MTGRLAPPAVNPPAIAYRSTTPLVGPPHVSTPPLPLWDPFSVRGSLGSPPATPVPTVTVKVAPPDWPPSLAATVIVATPERPLSGVTVIWYWLPLTRLMT